jgi:hypothetical protein
VAGHVVCPYAVRPVLYSLPSTSHTCVPLDDQPRVYWQVLRAVSPVVDASKLVVSIAAGVTSGQIAEVGVNAWLDPFDDKGL